MLSSLVRSISQPASGRRRSPSLQPLADRGPLRVLFVITSMPIGGAETLLMNLVRRFDADSVLPEICCLKEAGPLGGQLAAEFPVHSGLLSGKFDIRVLGRLRSLIRERRVDAVVTVGAGDKMFWGRLAAWLEGAPVICSALHSTGWPDNVGRLNRWLTPLTDAFIAVAERHGEYLAEVERFPRDKVCVIPNGIDVERFRPRPEQRGAGRGALGISPSAPLCGIVAALRPEKNHDLFIRAAGRVHQQLPEARFLIIGDGPERPRLETLVAEAGLVDQLQFLGSRDDIPQLLSLLDLFSLTSHNEANPVSILEALSTQVPVVATRVGSVEQTVREGETGFVVDAGDEEGLAGRWFRLLSNRQLASEMGRAGRQLVQQTASLEKMVTGYETLLCEIYAAKVRVPAPPPARESRVSV